MPKVYTVPDTCRECSVNTLPNKHDFLDLDTKAGYERVTSCHQRVNFRNHYWLRKLVNATATNTCLLIVLLSQTGRFSGTVLYSGLGKSRLCFRLNRGTDNKSIFRRVGTCNQFLGTCKRFKQIMLSWTFSILQYLYPLSRTRTTRRVKSADFPMILIDETYCSHEPRYLHTCSAVLGAKTPYLLHARC